MLMWVLVLTVGRCGLLSVCHVVTLPFVPLPSIEIDRISRCLELGWLRHFVVSPLYVLINLLVLM